MAQMSDRDLKKWSQLIAEAWSDDKVKESLVQNPTSVLQQHGIEVPPGIEIKVVENTQNVAHLILPAKPAGDVTELNAGELAAVAGGFTCICICGSCRTQDFPEDVFGGGLFTKIKA